MSAATLIFPHQLFQPHPAIARDRVVLLVEDTLFFGDAQASPGRFHQQKIVLHRASMKAFAAELESRGFEVKYIDYDRKKPIQTRISEWVKLGYTELHLTSPHDFLLNKRLRRAEAQTSCRMTFHSSPMFVTPTDWAEDHFHRRKKPFLAAFYEAQRKRLDILIEPDGTPTGGRWSFDDENRKPMPKRGGIDVPHEPAVNTAPEVEEALAYVAAHFSDYPGEVNHYIYPISHRASQQWLEQFLEQRFELFGPYEDAISTDHTILFHSVLTPMLNIGLLTPQQILDTTLTYAHQFDTPINSLEGFVRQIVGWREFMYLMYDRHGVTMRNSNFFDRQRRIPETFWTGETGVLPVDQAIKRVLNTGYCHHIERLMVLGNFMMLCGFCPTQVNDWFMELYIDAYDWVMVPNVYGMSQFADGGIFTTKPYISGSNYIKKMSNYPKGDWCDTWDGLFWTFIERERDFFTKQHRLGMMVRNLDKMAPEKRDAHRETAKRFLSEPQFG